VKEVGAKSTNKVVKDASNWRSNGERTNLQKLKTNKIIGIRLLSSFTQPQRIIIIYYFFLLSPTPTRMPPRTRIWTRIREGGRKKKEVYSALSDTARQIATFAPITRSAWRIAVLREPLLATRPWANCGHTCECASLALRIRSKTR
jgi:hypothetical protein